MTLYTIEEAADFLRMSKRTLYSRKEIPHVREGRRILFLKEDLEAWILAHREVASLSSGSRAEGAGDSVDAPKRTIYHKSPALNSKGVR